MMKGETVFTGAKHPGTELHVFHTTAGYYVGYLTPDGAPYSRESIYFETRKLATDFWLCVRR